MIRFYLFVVVFLVAGHVLNESANAQWDISKLDPEAARYIFGVDSQANHFAGPQMRLASNLNAGGNHPLWPFRGGGRGLVNSSSMLGSPMNFPTANFHAPGMVSNAPGMVSNGFGQIPIGTEVSNYLGRSSSARLWTDTTSFDPGFGPNTSLHRRVFVDALFLGRSGVRGGDFVFDDNGPALAYTDLNVGLGAGVRGGFQVMDNEDSGFEFVAWDLDDELTEVVNGPNVIPVFFGGIPAEPQPSYDVLYDTSLESLELNFWCRKSQNTRVGLGIRNIHLYESFDILRTADPLTGFRSSTDNQLYGLQAMIERRKFLGAGINFVAGGRFGGYYNDVDVEAFALNTERFDGDQNFSFAADFNAGLTMDWSQNMRVQFGYQGLIMTGVAVAPEQSEQFSFFNTAGDVAYGTAAFHGMYVGGTYAW